MTADRRMAEEKVTVIIPAYNAEATIRETLDSVSAQSHAALEIFAVDDGSSDGTADAIADLARRATVCVLPSFYEGLPLVLVEALACGCRLVATDLAGIRNELAPRLGEALTRVELPRLETVDRPRLQDLPAFVDRLQTALAVALEAPPVGDPARLMPDALAGFTWDAVYSRVEPVWLGLV